jgi:Protein of unknown function (DUF3102)
MTPELEGSNRLPVLAAEIMREHAEARRAAQMSVEHAIKAGEALLEAKKALGHGKWLPWLSDNCAMSERTAQLYMRLAKRKAKLENRDVADLTIRGAIKAITDERTDAQKAFALQAENEALRLELEWLRELLESNPQLPVLGFIIERATEIGRKGQLNRLVATHELGRLLNEFEAA